MKVYLNSVRGIDDALVSLLMSKRSWTREKEVQIRGAVAYHSNSEGFPTGTDGKEFFDRELAKLIKWGVENHHTTLIRYIDLNFTVEGLHRAGQDDWDSHAARMNNRIVRASTRLATFNDGEKSEFYQNKILYPFEAFELAGVKIPEKITYEDKVFVKTDFGYIDEDLEGDKDVQRGLYPLAIPSNFTFSIQYPELGHIYQHRNFKSTANPEVKALAEAAYLHLWKVFPILAENLVNIKMQGDK